MPVQVLKAIVRHQAEIAVIELHGEINGLAEETLYPAYDEAITQNPAVVLLNLAGVDYITSTGVAMIVSLLGRTLQANQHLATCGLNDHYTEIFKITRLTDFISMFSDETSAFNALQNVKAE
jgi:anti-anti-sigma factor